MNTAVLVATTCLVVVLALFLARELRIRRALQQLLARMLSHRNRINEETTTMRDAADPADDCRLQ